MVARGQLVSVRGSGRESRGVPPQRELRSAHAGALEAECERLLPLGAERVRLLYDGTDSCIVMQDIEGNEFCVD
jgi:hypothetical protein